MTATALPPDLLYGRLLATAAARFGRGGAPADGAVRRADGRVEPLPLERWLAPADDADAEVLGRVTGPALDIGCGPGRHVAALRGMGCEALGLDLSPIAVTITRERGADAILGSVFDEIPGAGGWRTALLLDGNVGIGGRPGALLRRARELLAPGGIVVAELDRPGTLTGEIRVRLESGDAVSEWFAWAKVGIDDARTVGAAAGLDLVWTLHAAERWFAGLRRS